MTKTRKTYTREFKTEAVRLLESSGQSAARVGKDLGIHPTLLSAWRRELAEHTEKAFPGSGHARDEEMARLRRELEVTRQERDILKKAVGIFSQQPR